MKVSELQSIVFSSLSLQDKMKIKSCERPVPDLNIVQPQPACKSRAAFTRRFDKNVYKKTKWLCGCEDKNVFFCFICLLFGGDDFWTKEGVNDLKHLQDKIKKHEYSAKHKNNFVSFQLLGGKTNIAANSIQKHNETVIKNREVLSKIIEALIFCGSCNLPLRRNENSDSSSRDVFLELINYSANIDPTLKSHLENAAVFKGTSKIIQNELLECMVQVCREHISNEIKQSSCLAFMVDDTADVSTVTQIAIVLRYELNGKVYERFWGFFNPETQDAEGIFGCILKELHPHLENCPDKLIAQTYDGAAVGQGHLAEVNIQIKKVYRNAHYIHCYAHQLTKLTEQVASHNSSARIFFGTLKKLPTFFSNSPERAYTLDQVSIRTPKPNKFEPKWNFQSRLIETAFTNQDQILQCFENIQSEHPKRYSVGTTCQAAEFAKWFNNNTFLFWLSFFHKVMPLVEHLHNQLQTVDADVTKIQQAIHNFNVAISEIRNTLPSDSQEQDLAQNQEPPEKRKRLTEENLDSAAKEVCDFITTRVNDRFQFENHLSGTKLFLRKNYGEYKIKLPKEDIHKFCEAFPMIDEQLLIAELQIFYSRPEVQDKRAESHFSSCLKTLRFLIAFGLDSTAFQEVAKALRILITMPMITEETERCFSTLKLIKIYLSGAVEEDRLTASGMLYIEKALVKEIPQFNKKVIDKFVSDKNRRMEFHFK